MAAEAGGWVSSELYLPFSLAGFCSAFSPHLAILVNGAKLSLCLYIYITSPDSPDSNPNPDSSPKFFGLGLANPF